MNIHQPYKRESDGGASVSAVLGHSSEKSPLLTPEVAAPIKEEGIGNTIEPGSYWSEDGDLEIDSIGILLSKEKIGTDLKLVHEAV